MSLVKYATLCDVGGCNKRSVELLAWPACAECLEHICDDHMAEGTATEDERNECLCIPCYEAARMRLFVEVVKLLRWLGHRAVGAVACVAMVTRGQDAYDELMAVFAGEESRR